VNNYVSGGYYIVKAIPRPSDLSEILPENLLTLSNCFTTVMRELIQLQWDNYADVQEAIVEEATDFGIEQSQIPDLVSWVKAQHNTHYHVFTQVESPLELRERFIRDLSAHVIGIGLHESLLDSFRMQVTKDINNGLGLVELIDEKRPVAEGGKPLGFEPLGFEATKFHSWLCHYAPNEIHKKFGIRPNRLGLIDQLEDACQVNDYLLRTGAEPAIWEPWLLVGYAPNSTHP
jgi:hypothetical protein